MDKDESWWVHHWDIGNNYIWMSCRGYSEFVDRTLYTNKETKRNWWQRNGGKSSRQFKRAFSLDSRFLSHHRAFGWKWRIVKLSTVKANYCLRERLYLE